MTPDRAGPLPGALRTRYAALQLIGSDPRSAEPEQAAARSAAALMLRRYPELAEPAPTGEPLDPSSDDAWAHGALVVANTARLARARVEALATIVRAHGCGHVQVQPLAIGGELRLTYYGLRPIVSHLNATLPAILAELDGAALTATRRYRQWLAGRDDHEPAWRNRMCHHWRRAYLTAYGLAYAARLADMRRPLALPARPTPHAAPQVVHHSAAAVAAADALTIDQAPLRAASTVIAASDLAVLYAAVARRRLPHPDRRPAVTATAAPVYALGG